MDGESKSLVERLRNESGDGLEDAAWEAADEIERLRKFLDDIIDGVTWIGTPHSEKAYRARDAYRG